MEEQIKKWKEQFGGVFRKNINGTMVYFRQLTSKEYDSFLSVEKTNKDKAQMEVINTCILHPIGFTDNIPQDSVIWENLYDSIRSLSIYDSNKMLSETKRLREERDNNLFKLLMSNIIAHIPAYKVEDLENRNIEQLLELAIFAESVPVSGGLVKEDIIKDPEEEKKRMMEENMRQMGQRGRAPDLGGKKKFTHPARAFHESALASSQSLKEALAAHGVNIRPIEQVKNDNANKGSFADKIRSLNRELEKRT